MTYKTTLNLAGFVAGVSFTVALILVTTFLTITAVDRCMNDVKHVDGEPQAVMSAVETRPVLTNLLIVQANYPCPGERCPRFSEQDILNMFRTNKGKVIEAEYMHYGPVAGTFYNFRLVQYMYRGVPTLAIMGDFKPNEYLVSSGLYDMIVKFYEQDSQRGIQLSILYRGPWNTFGHVAFCHKGAATDDFRLTEKEIIRIIE